MQNAAARFGEVIRRARSMDPQHIIVEGHDEVVLIAAEEFRQLKSDRTGEALVAALQASPCREIEIEPRRERPAVRDVNL
jgi:hypothetical protein